MLLEASLSLEFAKLPQPKICPSWESSGEHKRLL
jgi:hypothetical protein